VTEALLWATLAITVTTTFAVFVVLFARAQLAQANAIKIWTMLDERFDERVHTVTEKYLNLKKKQQPVFPPTPSRGTAPDPIAAVERVFGGAPFIPEQPEAEMEIAE
jgi:hypothetical protein